MSENVTREEVANRSLGEAYLSDRDLGRRYNCHHKNPWRWAKQGKFPQPVKISEGCTRWRLSDVERFEAQRAGEGEDGGSK